MPKPQKKKKIKQTDNSTTTLLIERRVEAQSLSGHMFSKCRKVLDKFKSK
jgi:hypothetical protein